MQRPKLVVIPSEERAIADTLPAQLTPLIGREQEVTTVCALLRRPEVRLLTLTGTGGIGKTRLALQVATDLLEDFAGGVCFVPLASTSDPGLVIPTIAQAFDLKETGVQSLPDLLKAFLRDQHLLLVLDNFEQILPAAPHLTDLLTGCPHLNILVTSRATLHVQGEHEFPVPTLALPDLTHLPELEVLAHAAAVTLFMQRAQAMKPEFQLTRANARAIVEICARLDGLPLAIELAAARIKLLSPHALRAWLEHPLQVLTGGTQDAPTRQQTLRNTIVWSYDLLSTQEQRLFPRLSVFVGGCTLEAIEAVTAALDDREIQVLDDVASLIDKSLLQQTEKEGEEPRLTMPETIREYGLERLTASGELEATRQTHAVYYLHLAEAAVSEMAGPLQVECLMRLEQEYDNLRTALGWLLEGEETKQRRMMALRLSSSLERFWNVRGRWSEGLNFLLRAIAANEGLATPERAKALYAAGGLALSKGDHERAEILAKESLVLFREIGETRGISHPLLLLGITTRLRGDISAARLLIEEALILSREVGDKEAVIWSRGHLADIAAQQREFANACALIEENVAMQRERRDKLGIASSLNQLAFVLFLAQGDLETSHSVLEESLTIYREAGYTSQIALSLYLSGWLALHQGNLTKAHSLAEESMMLFKELGHRAATAEPLGLLATVTKMRREYVSACALYEECLEVARKTGDFNSIIFCLEGLADVVASQGEPARAARLWGSAEALREAYSTPQAPVWQAAYKQAIATARTQLDEKAFAAAWAEGRAMTPDQALAAQGPATVPMPDPTKQSSSSPAKSAATYPDDLTAREVEVLRLLARGLTDAQIAGQLVISKYTASNHVKSILNKLGVTTRSAATRYAFEHQLV